MTQTGTKPNSEGKDELSLSPPRGMRDLLPKETALRDWATKTILETYEQFGFSRIETPALEHLQNLKGGEGGENLKLIYEVLKRGEKLDKVLESGGSAESATKVERDQLADLGLRFDLTVPLVRYFCNNQNNLLFPMKAIQIGAVWRAEAPQKGRFRQFTQCDIDILGVKSEVAETELLIASSAALHNLGFSDFRIRINDRRLLTAMVAHCGFTGRFDPIFIAIDKLDKIGIDGVAKDLLEHGHAQDAVEKLKAILTKAQGEDADLTTFAASLQVGASEQQNVLSEETSKAMQGLSAIIDGVQSTASSNYDIVFDPTLVRGMGYYTGPIFEIGVKGYSYSMGGGGRYDNMVEKFSGRDVPACGFSIGFERIIGVLMDRETRPKDSREKLALVFDPDRDKTADVMQAAAKLRNDGYSVSVHPRKKDMKKQLDAFLQHDFSKFVAFRGDVNNLEIKPLSKG